MDLKCRRSRSWHRTNHPQIYAHSCHPLRCRIPFSRFRQHLDFCDSNSRLACVHPINEITHRDGISFRSLVHARSCAVRTTISSMLHDRFTIQASLLTTVSSLGNVGTNRETIANQSYKGNQPRDYKFGNFFSRHQCTGDVSVNR